MPPNDFADLARAGYETCRRRGAEDADAFCDYLVVTLRLAGLQLDLPSERAWRAALDIVSDLLLADDT